VYVAVPVEPDGLRGLAWRMAGLSIEGARSLCTDSTGRICGRVGGEPKVVDGACAADCVDLP
jgi:hypothetical protein